MKIFFISLTVLFTTVHAFAQDPLRFKDDIEKFKALPIPEGEVTVITGSSSVRFWTEIGDDCDDSTIINTGFGGSEMSDLLYYLEDAVLRFKPNKVFIYEGDNDINSGKTVGQILETLDGVITSIQKELPGVEIFIIGAKPSPSRWQYKSSYEFLNDVFKNYSKYGPGNIEYIDVWNPMLNSAGRPKPEIFIADSLHMNRKGYDIWKNAICKYIQQEKGSNSDKAQIRENISAFSKAVMASDYQSIANAYTKDAKIFPNGPDIIEGRNAIKKYWTLPEGRSTKYHKITPVEIKINGEEAYDYGYYEGTTLFDDGRESSWRGKYVIIWRKTGGQWKIYLDIWNSIRD